jgi:hypothetical protein
MSGRRALLWIVAAGVVLDGLLAGSTVDRFVAGWPSWKRVGVAAWAEYSRHADLGYGLVLYPVLAIGGCLLALVAVVMVRRNAAARGAALPLYIGAGLSIAGLLTTFGAAPNMLALRHLDDPAALSAAFDAFYRWSAVRAGFQILLFPVEVWALIRASSATA